MKRAEYYKDRIRDCRSIYLASRGRDHAAIEADMRALGHQTFNRRCLYRDGRLPGWPERFGWKAEIDEMPEPVPANTPSINGFHAWLKTVSPGYNWEWPHLKLLAEKLQAVTDGANRRLMIFMPPRHGKSELVTARYTAWRLRENPKLNVIIGSYNQRLANRFSRKVRQVMADDAFIHAAKEDPTAKEDSSERPSPPAAGGSGIPVAPGGAERNLGSGEPKGTVHRASGKASSMADAKRRIINTESEWETPDGGGVRAVGVGAGVTGYGAGLIVIDDPVKSREQAESQAYRDKVWEWFNDDISTRLEPDGAVILIQTRWHQDDLAGRLLKQQEEEGSERWEVVCLPAIAESVEEQANSNSEPAPEAFVDPAFDTDDPIEKPRPWIWKNGRQVTIYPLGGLRPEFAHDELVRSADTPVRNGRDSSQGQAASSNDPTNSDTGAAAGGIMANNVIAPVDALGRKPGDPLCPARYGIDRLLQLKKQLGTYSFSALYQQRPIPADGGLFKRAWFRNVVSAPPPNLRWKRGFDLAVSGKGDADYTATFRVAFDKEGNLYIDGGYRARLDYPLQRRLVKGRIMAERTTEHGIELSANGNALLQELRTLPELRGRPFRGVRVEGNKISRALPWIALAEEGRVRLVAGRWNHDFVIEACSFPYGTHDDQIDAVSIAVAMARKPEKKLWVF